MTAGFLLCEGQIHHTSIFYKNLQLINPAYSGHSDKFICSAGYRNQWSNLESSPKSIYFSASTSAFYNSTGLGFSIIQDRFSLFQNTKILAQPSYKISNRDFSLTFGMNLGIFHESIRYDLLHLDPEALDDPLFTNQNNKLKLYIGTGIAFSNEYISMGISIPRLSSPVISGAEFEALRIKRMVSFTAMGKFPIDFDIDLQPVLMIQYQKGAPVIIDAGLNLFSYNIVGLGLFTKSLKTYGTRIELNLVNGLNLVYAFEVSSPSSLGFDYQTHEISLTIIANSLFPGHDLLKKS